MAESIPRSSIAKEIWMEWVWTINLQVLQDGRPWKIENSVNLGAKKSGNQKPKIKCLKNKSWKTKNAEISLKWKYSKQSWWFFRIGIRLSNHENK